MAAENKNQITQASFQLNKIEYPWNRRDLREMVQITFEKYTYRKETWLPVPIFWSQEIDILTGYGVVVLDYEVEAVEVDGTSQKKLWVWTIMELLNQGKTALVI